MSAQQGVERVGADRTSEVPALTEAAAETLDPLVLLGRLDPLGEDTRPRRGADSTSWASFGPESSGHHTSEPRGVAFDRSR